MSRTVRNDMFGLMKPPVEDLRYRSAYSRCCQLQRQWYGIASLPVLSYDAVFLYLCAVDAGLVPESVIVPQTCCRFRSGSGIRKAPDFAIGGFCGAVSIVLADTKLQDDVRDKNSIVARIGRVLLRKPVERAGSFLSRLNPHIISLMAAWTRAQIEVEAKTDGLTIDRFIGPTAEAVGTVARMLPGADSLAGLPELLQCVGQKLGTAIVAADCALDWQDDLRTGDCNPVRDQEGAARVARLAIVNIQNIVAACEASFGPASRTVGVSRMVLSWLCRTLQRRCHLPDDTLMTLTQQEPQSGRSQHDALTTCVSLAAKLGAGGAARSETGSKRSEVPKEIECPHVCQCSCQLLGSSLLLLGCANEH